MNNEHPITPPPNLVEKWRDEALNLFPDDECPCHFDIDDARDEHIAIQAARWGADQEIGQCIAWLNFNYPSVNTPALRADRRPKPPSLKQQALDALDEMNRPLGTVTASRVAVIRKALETLHDEV